MTNIPFFARRLVPGLVLLLAGAPALLAQAAIRVDSGVAIPMRDGVVLRADVVRPAAQDQVPVLIYRTPYGRTEALDSEFVRRAVARGYAVVVQDVRGRYGSEGEFEPYRHEGRDGYDTIEWAARQRWSSGATGSFGLSYPGAVQWLAAVEQPPSLRAMVPAMTYSNPESFWYSGGVWDGSWLDWVWFNIAPDLRRRLGRSGPRTDSLVSAAWSRDGLRARRHRPMLSLPEFQGLAPWYYEWMRHPPRDGWWRWAALDGRYSGVGAAVLNLSGWFDEPYGPAGAVDNYERLVATRPGDGRRAALVLGAWTHGGQSRDKAGDRTFGSAAAVDYPALILGWMDRFLKGSAEAVSDSAVRVFVMGANRWREASQWPLPGTRPDTLYLHPRAAPNELGRLLPVPPEKGQQASVIPSDPAAPLEDPFQGRPGAHDYRALRGQAGVALFETPPFAAPYELAGRVVAEIAANASVPDFDLWVQLYDVGPDGTAWNLSSPGSALMRASYRDGGPTRHLLQKGEVVTLKMNRLVTANRFLPGHRLRVILSTAFFPLFSVNPQTGRQEFESTETRAGEVRIETSPGRISRLILPVVSVED